MDFIECLPESNGYTDILVIVDRLTKQAIFVPTHYLLDAAGLAQLFIQNVFSKHGVPSHVTSDRGTEFISRFFKLLALALEMRLHFSAGYHPEADGQTERTNQTLEQYLQTYCNYQQSDWSKLLPLVEFTYNNTSSSTTGMSPFFANKGYHPNLQVRTTRELSSQSAENFVANLESTHAELKQAIAEAQKCYQGPADARRTRAPAFQTGDMVYVLAKFIRTTRPSRKLSERYLGPFPVAERVGSHSYLVNLPEHLRSIHLVFHISQLEPVPSSNIPNRSNPPPPPIEMDGTLEFELAQILDSKLDRRRTNPLMYYVQWAGYKGMPEEYSWLEATNLTNADELIQEFHSTNPTKPGPSTHSRPWKDRPIQNVRTNIGWSRTCGQTSGSLEFANEPRAA